MMNYHDLSRYRNELMGISIIMVILFHVGGMRHDTLWLCLSRCGNIGVDMFFFFSGIGMWFAWTKSRQTGYRKLLSFFRRRYLRIYPVWLVTACAYYIPRYCDGRMTLPDTLSDIAVNWGFWHHCELAFWFIPAIMMLYTVAPAYITLICRHRSWRWMPVAAVMLCVMLQYLQPLNSALGHLEIFVSRIPIFLLGINAGERVMERRPIESSARWMMLLTLAMGIIICVNFENGLRDRFPLFLERMVYIPMTVSMSLLLCRLFALADAENKRTAPWVRRATGMTNRALAFTGGVSLEIYLVHYQFVIVPFHLRSLSYWPKAFATLAIAIPAAWVLHKVVGHVVRKLEDVLKWLHGAL